ncbi:hypothetical protein BDZ45DRAFT_748532 [Acephala macrosclerotiorum]|nr:hypothetical protein BDZ45DRAFT_748532 [Acephala macrosclerotiorum]
MNAIELNEGGKAHQNLEQQKRLIMDRIRETIEPFLRVMNDDFELELIKILQTAITLDMELCRRAARILWVFEDRQYDASYIELETGEAPDVENHRVQLVVVPGVKKKFRQARDCAATNEGIR